MQTVLCIEDEREFRESISDFLRAEGFSVLEAANGRDGIEHIISHQPDLVLCDVNMPVMSGFQLLSQLRAAHPEKAHAPFIFLTGCSQRKDRVTARMLGVEDYLVKPVDFDVLMASVRARLQQAQDHSHIQNGQFDGFRSMMMQFLCQEIRTPLNTIIGFSDIVGSGTFEAASPKLREFAQGINGSAYDILYRLNNALDTTMLVSGHLQVVEQSVDVDGIIWECLYSIKNYPLYQGMLLREEVSPDLSLLRADSQLIARMITTWLLESQKHARANDTLLVKASLNETEQMVISICGMRLGIPREEKFAQDEPISASTYENLSAGRVHAHFSQAVMKAHQGSLSWEQAQDGSTILHMIFPLSRLEE